MVAGAGQVASACAMLVHTSLVPAGSGAVAALVAVSAPAGGRLLLADGPATRSRPGELRALAAAHRLAAPEVCIRAGGSAVGTLAAPAATGTTSARHRTLWQLAAVCTAASAVVHAVAGPHHAQEHLVFGVFFFLVACAQFTWSAVALLSPTRAMLRHGVGINGALIALWAVTRTTGLPFGLQQGPEAAGAWDLSSKLWELAALACCGWLLTGDRSSARTSTGRASRVVVAAAAGSVLVLLVLGLSGPPT